MKLSIICSCGRCSECLSPEELRELGERALRARGGGHSAPEPPPSEMPTITIHDVRLVRAHLEDALRNTPDGTDARTAHRAFDVALRLARGAGAAPEFVELVRLLVALSMRVRLP